MLNLEEYTYKFDYIKNDGTSGIAYYTVLALNDQKARMIAADKFRADREKLINS